jgi:preprotein translocase subunit SecE
MASEDDNEDVEREEEEAREERPERREPPRESADDRGAGTRTLGVERWVQFGFIAAAALAFWLSDKLINSGWEALALRVNTIPEPDPTTVTLAAVFVALVGGFFAYRNEKARAFAHEAATELQRVSWPSRKETWTNTVVVVITSVIAAGILFGFDAAWSAVTDLIY